MRNLLLAVLVVTGCSAGPIEDEPITPPDSPLEPPVVVVPRSNDMGVVIENLFVAADFSLDVEVQRPKAESVTQSLPDADSAIRVGQGQSVSLSGLAVQPSDTLVFSVKVSTLGTVYVENRIAVVPQGATVLSLVWNYSESADRPVLFVEFVDSVGQSLGFPEGVRTRLVAVTSLLDNTTVDMVVFAGGMENPASFNGQGFKVVGRIPVDAPHLNISGTILSPERGYEGWFGEDHPHLLTKGSTQDINIVLEWSEPDGHGYENLKITIVEGEQE